jgi:hypothetical protein
MREAEGLSRLHDTITDYRRGKELAALLRRYRPEQPAAE